MKAKKYLLSKNFCFEEKDIVLNTPDVNELDNYITLSGKNINKFFNTSGLKYRELGLKNKLLDMSYEDKLKLLASDGMLIKRPILVCKNKVLVGFKEVEWRDIDENS